MSEFKEVWYVWDGVGVPSHAGSIKKVLHRDGLLSITSEFPEVDQNDPSVWRHSGFSQDITSYTLCEKRRRCDLCYGNGKVFHPIDDCSEICPKCNGTGWEYEK